MGVFPYGVKKGITFYVLSPQEQMIKKVPFFIFLRTNVIAH